VRRHLHFVRRLLDRWEMMERDLDNGLGQYVTYREHIAAKEEAQKRQSAVEMEVATIRAALMHLPDDVRKLTDAVQTLASKMPAQSGQTDSLAQAINAQSLAMQRMFDTMKQHPTTAAELLKLLNTQPPNSSGKTWALVGALAMVALFLGWQAFSG
jgi:hypothetical protein